MTSLKDSIVLFFLVGAGGALGAMLRFGVWLLTARWCDPRTFPVATLAVNCVGCLAIGYLTAAVFHEAETTDRMRLLWVTGVLGGFTTYSAFSIETVTLLAERRYAAATAYVLLSTVGGIALAAAGVRLGK